MKGAGWVVLGWVVLLSWLMGAGGGVAGEVTVVAHVRNGDMSLGDTVPAEWSLAKRMPAVSLARDTDVYRSAPSSLKVIITTQSVVSVQQRLSANPTGELRVCANVKAEGQFKNAQLVCQAFDKSWKQLQWIPIAGIHTGDWQTVRRSINVTRDAVHVLLCLALNGEGRVWLDDVSAETGGSMQTSLSPSCGGAREGGALRTATSIAAADDRIRYVGRIQRTAGAVVFAWPAVEATLRFKGSGDVGLRSRESGKNRLQVVVDGKETTVITLGDAEKVYPLAVDLPPGDHTLSVVKITEALFGSVKLTSFELPAGAELLPVPSRSRRIEVVGDSISAGFGNEAANEKALFSPKTENAYLAYGAIAARRMGADYVCIAWSGKTMAPSNTLPAIYGRTLPLYEGSQWVFAEEEPDVILINLGTNDFAGSNPEEEGWVKAYLAFLTELRARWSKAWIYCAIGPMLSDPWSPSKSALTTIRRYIDRIVAERNLAGDIRVKRLDFDQQTAASGFGAQWHPSLQTHRLMADRLVMALRADLEWVP